MNNTLVVCGGTGAHTALAFLRLHTLGYALGFFDRSGRRFDFPNLYLVDQDAGDGSGDDSTAWQLAKGLVERHPGRRDWHQTIRRPEPPELKTVTPLPVGPAEAWYKRPNNTLENRFEGSPYRDALTSPRQQSIDYSKGMMGSPAVGSLLFRLKEHDQNDARLNHDRTFGQLLESKGRIAVTGSGVGGTGASIAPTLAERLSRGLEEGSPGAVMAILLLEWFKFDESEGDAEIRGRAQRRNRRMHENAHSALEYYGQGLASNVATVPVGLPKANLLTRRFTGDVGQPVRESFVHAVAALTAYRHFLAERPFAPGLYMMGAVEKGRLDGGTAIPGGTLQDLANQAMTVAELLDVWRRTLVQRHEGRMTPAIYDAVAAVSRDPVQVADSLEREAEHFRAQITWMGEVLGVKAVANRSFSREMKSRIRLAEDRKPLRIGQDSSKEEVASALFHWTAEWVSEEASSSNGLVREAAPVDGGHWPDLRNVQGLGVSASANGDLTRIDDANRDAVLEAFVDQEAVSVNGWPHPIAAADFFKEAVRKRDPVALRQLELLLVGVVSRDLELQRLHGDLDEPRGVSLERLIADERRDGTPGLAEFVVVKASSNRILAFTSPDTLFAPVPSIGREEADELWGPLWREITGSSDGAHWQEAKAPASWGEARDKVILHILSWVDHLKKIHGPQAPPWTRIFENHSTQDVRVPFGTGTQLQVLWGDSGEALQRIDIHLPTTEIEEWSPPPGTPTLDEATLFERISGLRALRNEQGDLLYEMVEFEVPEHRDRMRGWWADHLDLLKRRGEIHIWSRTAEGAVVIGMVDTDGLKAATLAHSRVLDHKSVAVKDTVPFRQEPVPGSRQASDALLWPDLPIFSDYVDLVQTQDGSDVFHGLKEGEDVDFLQWRPQIRREEGGRLAATWSLNMRGRREPLVIQLRVRPPERPEDHHWAHWIVWPRFRSKQGDVWSTYYAYQRSSHQRLRADALWLDASAEQPRLSRSPAPEKDVPTYPIRYRVEGQHPAHVGGPPLALIQRDLTQGEQGLYFVPLEILPSVPVGVEIAVDFGTSHSVAAAQVDGDQTAQPVRLTPELLDHGKPLSIHVSESWSHVKAPSKDVGLLAEGAWLPTYTEGDRQHGGILPSDLIYRGEIKPSQTEQLDRWVAGFDYRIPPLDIGRGDLSKVLVTDFKWEAGVTGFRGKESILQEHYLTMFLELTLAEVVAARCKGFPTPPIQLTFTYPLRNRRDQVERYQRTLRRVLVRVQEGTGLTLQLQDDIGIYDESRAARLTAKKFGEVIQVADLGGGTLDLFISAKSDSNVKFPQVTDSARLGGNLLLRQIAESPEGLLPVDGNWGSDARDTETKLRAWMRTVGSPVLFGLESPGDRPVLDTMDVAGFPIPAGADRARHLIDRYFRLVVEYLARNLAAYLVHHWYPKVKPEDYKRLLISVQLRGNGWRMRYQRESYIEATRSIQKLVRERLIALWDDLDESSYPVPSDPKHWASAEEYAVADPKTAPIQSVVGRAQRHEDVEGDWHSHTPVDLEVHRDGSRQQLSWGATLPFHTGGSTHVEVHELSPPVPLTNASQNHGDELRNLDAERQGRINGALQEEGVVDPATGDYRAPVGPLVWETIFDSRYYWPEG